ncbi:unnamed protein product [Closterium sp. Yama58-4]|nr:unnamed protein product [Closterium sp. Yama58-4]
MLLPPVRFTLAPAQSLPDSICQLSSLETFSLLSCDSICELAAGFGCLTTLTTLCLRRVVLPEDIGHLSNLQMLLVKKSSQQHPLPSSLSEISSLTSLLLHQCGVEELPEGVGELSKLRELHVSSCSHLTALPALLTNPTCLQALILSGCTNLTSVPTRWDGLTRLKCLEVTACGKLTRLDQLLSASLETLSWGSYRQAMVSAGVSRLTWLRDLSLTRVIMAMLPADIGSALPQLQNLMLVRVGELRELPASVPALQNLTSLGVHLAPNLPSLPQDISALSWLRELLVVHCTQLKHLPASLTQLACLNDLSILHCSIHSLCPKFSWLACHKSLNLSLCRQLQALPTDLSELKELQVLDVHECELLTDIDSSVLPMSIIQTCATPISSILWYRINNIIVTARASPSHSCVIGVQTGIALRGRGVSRRPMPATADEEDTGNEAHGRGLGNLMNASGFIMCAEIAGIIAQSVKGAMRDQFDEFLEHTQEMIERAQDARVSRKRRSTPPDELDDEST